MGGIKRRPFLTLCIFLIMTITGCSSLNDSENEGDLPLPGLREKVRVLRDGKGMPYIYAANLHDAMLAQGFIAAQDRLFQMELTRLFSSGRICELVGAKGKPLDIRMRTIGFRRNAEKQARLLDKETRIVFQKYVDGINAYIKTRPETFPLEFKLAGIQPGPWTIADSLTIMFYMSWNSSANLKTEITAQMLVERLGEEKAREIFPLNINPDEKHYAGDAFPSPDPAAVKLSISSDKTILGYLKDVPSGTGSNNWAIAPRHSASGKTMLANDPHLDSRILPGPWYPSGIIIPQCRFVGVGVPGTPGFVIGRNEHIAVGVTNAYADTQDLYVETLDPKDSKRYLEGNRSIPFEIIEETLTIKDKDAPQGTRQEKISIRLTGRGPVISGVLPGLKTKKVLTLRWAHFENMGPSLGLLQIMTARSVSDVRKALESTHFIALNFVFADTAGNIGWQVSGRLPVRSQGEATVPFVVKDSRDNWTGWIPYQEMPQSENPEKGWVGTCNHKTVTDAFPFYYSSHLAPSYRYRRLIQLMDSPGKKSTDDHWRFQRDTFNLTAEVLSPIMAKVLMADEDTKVLGHILSEWDHRDDKDQPGPTVFQTLYRRFAYLAFQDELGEDVTRNMLANTYFWQERVQSMMVQGTSAWFDNVKTGGVKETRDDLLRQAAKEILKEMGESLDQDPKKWHWGKVHQIEFVSPIRRSGFGKGLLGGGSHPMDGSGETLYAAKPSYKSPFDVTVTASLRMVVDLGDNDKVLAVLPGGTTARLFVPHTTDQIEAFMNGEKLYWWFSDNAIEKHAKTTLTLNPN
ncbi:MAG: penicillin acylase family protein [Deltaproteobacteria bacterium]|nr:penicillin acylase family protein [Deltaproteobacteria bacterium]